MAAKDKFRAVSARVGLRYSIITVRNVVLFVGAVFVLRFATFYLDDLTRGLSGTAPHRFVEEFSGALAGLMLFPFLIWGEDRWSLYGDHWRRHALPVLAMVALYSAAHTTIMAVVRQTLHPLLGLGPYDYGRMSVRYFMEAPNDIIACAGVLALLTILRVHDRLRAEELRATALAKDAAEAQLRAVTLQLQPHFLFNALNTISSVVYDDPSLADHMIGSLGELLRASLQSTPRKEIALSEELELLQAYLAIVEARFGDTLRCEITVDPGACELAVPAFLLQPLVENAVRHGSVASGEAGAIRVSAVRVERTLRIEIENDVSAISAGAGGNGTGQRTTAERLRLLYGDDQRVRVTSGATRYRVSIEIPARRAEAPADHVPYSESRDHAGADR